MHVTEFDYSRMRKYEYTAADAPTYLRDTYGLDVGGEGCWNIGKLMRDNFEFMDSQKSIGLQAVDLLASGIRRCLRKGFGDNEAAAFFPGRLMIQAPRREPPIRLMGFSLEDKELDEELGKLASIMTRAAILLP
jgi:hypothetical protein